MDGSGKPIVKIEKLCVAFGQGTTNETKVLDEITLDIYPHEYLILYGPSGCGKSTLLNVISGLLKPTSGKVEIDGKGVETFSEKEMLEYHRLKIGMIFQSFYLVSTLSVLDNVCLPRAFMGDDLENRKRDGLNYLKRFGIFDQAEKFPRDLSGGQRQRVAIARSLINGPSIIVADEPVGNLDSKSSYNVLSILQELNEVDKKLVILVTHDPSHLAYGDRVIHMRDGRITKIVEVVEKRRPRIGDAEEAVREKEEVNQEWMKFKEGILGKAWDLYQKGARVKDWELIKKEELGKAWEVFQKAIPEGGWEMGEEYELVKKKDFERMTKEQIAPDLLALMRTFRNLSPEQVGTLIIPFKAQQIFTHIFFQLADTQLDLAKKIFQDYIAGGITVEDFGKRLTDPESKGGAGWDRYHARRFVEGAQRIFEQVQKVDYSDIRASADTLAARFSENYHLELGSMENVKFKEYVKMRLENEIAMDEFLSLIDRPVTKGGVGLDHRTAVKMARELEIIMLARYSM